ncbi:MAG: MarR family transcriptional regulator [Myxococcota bacterium]
MNEADPKKGARRRTKKALLEELAQAGRAMSGATVLYHATLAAKLGLSASEEKAIDIIEREGSVTAGRLTELSGLAPASVTGLVDRLEKKGFVKRVADEADKRRVRVVLDPTAMQRFGPLFVDWFASLAELFDSYTVAELEVILDFMTKVAERQRIATDKLASS